MGVACVCVCVCVSCAVQCSVMCLLFLCKSGYFVLWCVCIQPGADGVFIVYDASALGDEYTDPEDQRAGLHYLVPPTFPSVLFGNKIDLIYLRGEHAKRELQARQNDKKETHFFGSALSGENVEEAFECLVRQVVSRKVRDEGMGLPHRKTIKLSRKSLRAVSSSASRGECC